MSWPPARICHSSSPGSSRSPWSRNTFALEQGSRSQQRPVGTAARCDRVRANGSGMAHGTSSDRPDVGVAILAGFSRCPSASNHVNAGDPAVAGRSQKAWNRPRKRGYLSDAPVIGHASENPAEVPDSRRRSAVPGSSTPLTGRERRAVDDSIPRRRPPGAMRSASKSGIWRIARGVSC